MREVEKFIGDDLTNKAKDISRFTQQANEQEFIVCRFLIGWSVASIGALVMFYLQNLNTESPKTIEFLLSLRKAFLSLGGSILFGIFHYLFSIRKLLRKSKELDGKIRTRIKKIKEKGTAAIPELKNDLEKEYTEETVVLIGSKGFLYLQIALFLFGIGIIFINMN